MPTIWAVIPAAGKGKRLSKELASPKQFYLWRGQPLYLHSVQTFSRCPLIKGIVLVFPLDRLEQEREDLAKRIPKPALPILCCAGGAERSDSVARGLELLPKEVTHVCVHDAARPFVSAQLIVRVCEKLAAGCEAVIPVLPVTDTIKLVQGERIVRTLERENLVQVQTPQAFSLPLLREAHQKKSGPVTDDASLMEAMGVAVTTVNGEPANIKITSGGDLNVLKEREQACTTIGQGYDVHRFGESRPFRLGGIAIPGPNLEAHSDGDVLLHALIDALLGCAGLGDIGSHFPDTDPAYANISSAALLDRTLTLLDEHKVRPIHVDVTVIAQKPKISPYRLEIRNNLARLLDLERDAVNVKATTEEGLGLTGRMEGIKACAIVLARKYSFSQDHPYGE